MMKIITANLVNIPERRIFHGSIHIQNGTIKAVHELQHEPVPGLHYIIPGFTDAHVHIESSMLVPAEFARMAVVHGTVATLSDPHEIANVCGVNGVLYMIENGNKVPFKFNFGAPSCVPATTFETAGASLNSSEVAALLQRPDIHYLSEMMNYPGVLNADPVVMEKIAAAKDLGKPVDGHAPGLRGQDAGRYIAAGISTDHECFTYEEALDKLEQGMQVIIREGSAARNFDALAPLLHTWSHRMMLCSDDKHPDSLLEGHINTLCARAVAMDIDVFNVLQAACINPVVHYKLPVGMLRQGDPADFAIVKDLTRFEVMETWIDGQQVASGGKTLIEPVQSAVINHFKAKPLQPADFEFHLHKWGEEENFEQVHAIEALDGQLITNKLVLPVTHLRVHNHLLYSNTDKDLLKLVVINRYHAAPMAKCFIHRFGLKKGAIASTVAHDSHNIIAIGVDDESLSRAVNLVIGAQGGIAATDGDTDHLIALPVAGLMTTADGYDVAQAYTHIDQFVKQQMGSTLRSPFMTLSFMALLVIPHLKLSDLGLFDGDEFRLL
jgi:adenine deaminase